MLFRSQNFASKNSTWEIQSPMHLVFITFETQETLFPSPTEVFPSQNYFALTKHKLFPCIFRSYTIFIWYTFVSFKLVMIQCFLCSYYMFPINYIWKSNYGHIRSTCSIILEAAELRSTNRLVWQQIYTLVEGCKI